MKQVNEIGCLRCFPLVPSPSFTTHATGVACPSVLAALPPQSQPNNPGARTADPQADETSWVTLETACEEFATEEAARGKFGTEFRPHLAALREKMFLLCRADTGRIVGASYLHVPNAGSTYPNAAYTYPSCPFVLLAAALYLRASLGCLSVACLTAIGPGWRNQARLPLGKSSSRAKRWARCTS